MEGPYMSGEGSNQNSILWRGEIRPEEYRPLIDAMRGFARIWAIDPARPGIERFMQDVRRADPNAIFALGHSHATAAQCRRARLRRKGTDAPRRFRQGTGFRTGDHRRRLRRIYAL